MGSMGGKVYAAAIRSTRMEVAAIAKREDTRVCPPSSFQPRRNMGMFSTSTTVPMGRPGIRRFRIMPRAVIPPKPISLGT